MLKLHPTLNLIDARPVHPSLQLSKRLSSVYGFRVLAPVQKPWRFTAADAGGGPVQELLCSSAHTAHKPLAFPGAVRGARKRGGGEQKGLREGGIC